MEIAIIKCFVGYDPREAIAFHVCANSIIRHASEPVQIIPLATNMLKGFDGRRDGSNDFIYSRFLVPALCDFNGGAIFVDGDMVFTGDIAELWALRDFTKDVQVVKHDYTPKTTVKYLGNKQEAYPRKNWSSVMLFANCGNYPLRILSPDFVGKATGAYLHRFQFLKDERIGELDPVWNWLPQEYGPNALAKIIHYTNGTPCFGEYSDDPMAGQWHLERALTLEPIVRVNHG